MLAQLLVLFLYLIFENIHYKYLNLQKASISVKMNNTVK